MRHCVLVLALLMAACGPSPPSGAPMPDATGLPMADSDTPPDNSAILAATPAEGAWTFDSANRTASYGPSGGPYVFQIACTTITSHVRLILRYEQALDVHTFLRVLTRPSTYEFAARGFDGANPKISAGMDAWQEGLVALTQEQDRIAIEYEDTRVVIPWDPLIASTIRNCRPPG